MVVRLQHDGQLLHFFSPLFLGLPEVLSFPWNNSDDKPFFAKCEIHIKLHLLYDFDIIRHHPENGVIFYLIDHVVQIGVAQVDAADLIAVAAPLHHDPQRHASDPAKTVDANFNRHVTVPPPHILPGVPQVWFQL